MFITQISAIIDELVAETLKEFKDSNLYKKISNLVFVPVVKESKNEGDWCFSDVCHIEIAKDEELCKKLEEDYNSICKQLREHILNSTDGFIHTSNGVNGLIQIRSKDAKDKSGKYHPIFSKVFNLYVSNKNHAFYFKKDFMIMVRNVL